MKIAEYAENFSGAPMFLEEFANAALSVDDDEAFVAHAEAFLSAMEAFESELAARDIEMG